MKQSKRLLISFLIIMLVKVYWNYKLQEMVSFLEARQLDTKIIENFDSLQGWAVIGEGAKIDKAEGVKKNCLVLSYKLEAKTEWVVVSKKFDDLRLPENYQISFYIKGEGPENNLEFKLIDKDGNVFWKKWENFKFPEKWLKIVIKKHDISFAWGPNPGAKLSKVDKIEIAISRGSGGKGKVYIDELSLQTLKEEKSIISRIKAKASSIQEPGLEAKYAVDGNKSTRWSSQFSDDQWLEIDMGEVKEIVGLTLLWETAYGKAYDILVSIDRKKWKKVYTTDDGDGATDVIYFKKSKARYIKIQGRKRATAWGYSLWEVTIKMIDEQPIITASSYIRKNRPENILDGDQKTKWISKSSKKEWIKIDLQKIKTFGGLFLYWDEDYAKCYEIKISLDNKDWETVYSTKNGNGDKDKIYFDKVSARFIKINFIKSANKKSYALKEVEIKGPDEFLTAQKYYEVMAEESPGGYFPRWLYKEQAFWTVVGVEKDLKESLLCEDGSVEPYKNFTITPFLYFKNRLITSADVKLIQSLEKVYLPIPSVEWKYKNIVLNIKLFAYGKAGESITYVWYKIKNRGKRTIKGDLFLTIRPFQINPPWQPGGGLSKIRSIEYDNSRIKINNSDKIFPLIKPDDFGANSFKDGDVVYVIEKGEVPKKKRINDKEAYASAVIKYEFNLRSGEYKDFFLAIPLYNKGPELNVEMSQDRIKRGFQKMIKKNVSSWESKLNKVKIEIPDSSIVNTLKANIAYILINRDGPAIQPGSRTYEHAWIRDGSMTCSALLKMGITEEVKEYLDWYSGFIKENGEVPAIINNDNGKFKPNPIKEYDAQGEFIFAVLQYYYFTRDKEFLKKKLPVVIKVLKYLEYLRNQRITDRYRGTRYYGILPNSVSHEGYFPEPGMHSYWDDFFGIKGWKDAIKIAEILDRKDLLDWMKREERKLRESVYKSIELTIKEKNINYIPGCAEKGDFDATSTAIAVMVCDELEYLPQPELKNTFDKYYNDLLKRFKPDWNGGFTPYEVRSVQAFIYMNQKERALRLLKFLLDCRRPLSWNHFAEVVFSNPRLAQYIGDMPHTWVGSGYINAVRSMFVYEKDGSLILGAGIDEKWLSKGVSIKNMPTYFGKINYSVRKEKNRLKVKVWGKANPEKGFLFKMPLLKKKIKKVNIDGKKWKNFSDRQIYFEKLPVDIEVIY